MLTDYSVSAKEMNLFPYYSVLVLLLPIFFYWLKQNGSPKTPPLPPGPKPWPIVGNLFQLGEKVHFTFTHFSKLYGPLISLRLGSPLYVVASSPAAASEILKTHDRLLSARYIFQMTPSKENHNKLSFVFSPECNETWRSLRSICRANLFTAKAIESQASLRKRKMNEMVEYLSYKEGNVVQIKEIVFSTVFNTLANLFFSRDLIGFEDDLTHEVKGPLQRTMSLGLTPNLADFFTLLEGLDLQGLRKKAAMYLKEIDAVWRRITDERRRTRIVNPIENLDFLDVLLDNEFSNEQINYLALEVLSAGTDTTTTTVEWAMAELLKNKHIMEKVSEEIRREINGEDMIDESKISQLPYLQACIKETLRLHPPAQFLLPRRALQTCEVMNYTIPKETRIFVNVWAIGRDPSCWEDPLLFKPERFIGSDLDFKGQDYQFIPFGGGRRICPGMPMATVQVSLILATLIHYFDWSLPNGEDPSQLDMSEKLGIVMHKEKPLLLIPKRKV